MPRLVFTNVFASDLAIGNSPEGFARGFVIPAAGLTRDISGEHLEQLAPQLDAHRSAGRITWVQSQNPSVSDQMEVLSGAGRASLIATVAYAAKSATAIHAGLAGNAALAFPGPFTNAANPRNANTVCGVGYDGGNVNLVGTDFFDLAQTETIAGVASATTQGVKIWKTITSATRTVVGASAATVSLGTGDKMGIPFRVSGTAGLLFAGATLALSVPEVVVVDPVNSAFTPTSVPNGSIVFSLLVNTGG